MVGSQASRRNRSDAEIDYGSEEERVFERQKPCLIEPIRSIIQLKINFSCTGALEKNCSNY